MPNGKKKKRNALTKADKIAIIAVIVDIIAILVSIALHFF